MISKIFLDNFRNYQSQNFLFNPDITVIVGDNGVGKTNILEAISLFRKGRGIRSSDLDQMVLNNETGPMCSKEGIVTRNFDSFDVTAQYNNIFKYVRKGHVQTNEHWSKNWKRASLIWEKRV